jgi:hypothetical protein
MLWLGLLIAMVTLSVAVSHNHYYFLVVPSSTTSQIVVIVVGGGGVFTNIYELHLYLQPIRSLALSDWM